MERDQVIQKVASIMRARLNENRSMFVTSGMLNATLEDIQPNKRGLFAFEHARQVVANKMLAVGDDDKTALCFGLDLNTLLEGGN